MRVNIMMTPTAQALFTEKGRINAGNKNEERELIKQELGKKGLLKEQSPFELLSETEMEEFAEELNRRYNFSVQPAKIHMIAPLVRAGRAKLNFSSLQSRDFIVLSIDQLPFIFIDATDGLLIAFKNPPADLRSVTRKMKHIQGSRICLIDYNSHSCGHSCGPLLFTEWQSSFQVSVLTNSPQNFPAQPTLLKSFSSQGLTFMSRALITQQPAVLSRAEECVILLVCLLRWTCTGSYSQKDGDVKIEEEVALETLAGRLAALELYATHLGDGTFQCVVMTYFNIFAKLNITDPLPHQFQSAHKSILREISLARTKHTLRVTQAYFTCDEHYPLAMKYRKECKLSKQGMKCMKTKYSCSGCSQFCGREIALCLNCFDRFHREDHHLLLKSGNKATKRERILLAKQKAVSQGLLRQNESEQKMREKQSQLQTRIKSVIQIQL